MSTLVLCMLMTFTYLLGQHTGTHWYSVLLYIAGQLIGVLLVTLYYPDTRIKLLHRLGYCHKQRAGFKCTGRKGECN